jgi:hypothetical protein
MDLSIKFANSQQRAFYYSNARNQTFSGGFNNGKTYAGCLKAFTLLTTFPNYRVAIARQVLADLKRTTMQTFFKICPRELIERHNEQDGLTVLKNRSQINWMHLDKVDESSLRGLEINSVLVDQAEETEEKVYDVLDARIGRWDGAEIPASLLSQNPDWPTSKQGKLIAPSYIMLLCNPDTQYHYIYRKYHPDSLERDPRFFFIEGQWDSTLGSEESYEVALRRGEEWVEKYVKGRWGLSEAQIHRVSTDSLIDPSDELLDRIRRKGNLFKSMDHGDSSPTCCLWFASLNGVYICYREYYLGNEVISKHRRNITELSFDEKYTANYADPQIFKKTAQRDGGFWTVADEYLTRDIPEPPLSWLPADNNEYATRNRINELLRPSPQFRHPVTAQEGAPGLYFIKRTPDYQYGAFHAISQLQSQRRKLLGYVDGKSVYVDEREESVTDHAYDPTRYFIAQHGSGKTESSRPITSRNSFAWFKMMKKRSEGLQAASAN